MRRRLCLRPREPPPDPNSFRQLAATSSTSFHLWLGSKKSRLSDPPAASRRLDSPPSEDISLRTVSAARQPAAAPDEPSNGWPSWCARPPAAAAASTASRALQPVAAKQHQSCTPASSVRLPSPVLTHTQAESRLFQPQAARKDASPFAVAARASWNASPPSASALTPQPASQAASGSTASAASVIAAAPTAATKPGLTSLASKRMPTGGKRRWAEQEKGLSARQRATRLLPPTPAEMAWARASKTLVFCFHFSDGSTSAEPPTLQASSTAAFDPCGHQTEPAAVIGCSIWAPDEQPPPANPAAALGQPSGQAVHWQLEQHAHSMARAPAASAAPTTQDGLSKWLQRAQQQPPPPQLSALMSALRFAPLLSAAEDVAGGGGSGQGSELNSEVGGISTVSAGWRLVLAILRGHAEPTEASIAVTTLICPNSQLVARTLMWLLGASATLSSAFYHSTASAPPSFFGAALLPAQLEHWLDPLVLAATLTE